MLGLAQSATVLTGRGAEPQSNGVNNVLSLINIAPALGKVGRPHSGYGCLTGQGNGRWGREHGQKADQLSGYRLITDPMARKHVAAVWGVPPEGLPGPGKSAYEMLDSLGEEGAVEALLVLGSNIVISAPNAEHVEQRLQALDFLVVADFVHSETSRLADVVLPTAQWTEEEGTMTNLEGRVIRRRAALAPPPGVSTDLDLICELAGAWGRAPISPTPALRECSSNWAGPAPVVPQTTPGLATGRLKRARAVLTLPRGRPPGYPSDVPGRVPHCQR